MHPPSVYVLDGERLFRLFICHYSGCILIIPMAELYRADALGASFRKSSIVLDSLWKGQNIVVLPDR
jgi:hypothetical protein